MTHLSDANVLLAAMRTVLIQNGEHAAAEQLRGIEVFTASHAQEAISVVEAMTLNHPDSLVVQEATLGALRESLNKPAAA